MARDLVHVTEAALTDAATSAGLTGVVMFEGSSSDDNTVPCVISTVDSVGPEEPLETGNHMVSATVKVISNASDDSGHATHEDRVSAVFDIFRSDSIVATLSGDTSGFSCQFVRITGSGTNHDDDKFEDFLSLDIYCNLSDIT